MTEEVFLVLTIVDSHEEFTFDSKDITIISQVMRSSHNTASCRQCGFLAAWIAFSLRVPSLPSSLESPTAPASFPIVDRLVELLCLDRGIAMP